MGRALYIAGRIANDDVEKILLEGLPLHEDRALPTRQIMRHPVLFPFDVVLKTYDLRRSSRFEVYRQRLDMDVVALVRTNRRAEK